MEARMVGRTPVQSAELAGIDAFVHDDTFADLIKNHYNSYNQVEPAVKKVLYDAGITLTQKQIDDIVQKIADVGVGWKYLEKLENSLGRTGMG
jgi:hypothetical protein